MVGIALLYANNKISKDYFMNLLDPPEQLTPHQLFKNLRVRAEPKGLVLKKVDYPEGMLSMNLAEFYPEFA